MLTVLMVFSSLFLVRRNFEFLVEENSVLLATDVAARGLDIRDVQHVIHYQVPRTAEVNVKIK